MTAGGSNRMLSMRDAAEHMGVKYLTLAGKYKEWHIPHYRFGRLVQFRERDLETWMESRRVA